MAIRGPLLSLLLATAITGKTAYSQSPPVITELDPTIAITLDVNSRVRIEGYTGRETSEEIGSAKTRIGADVSFRVKPIYKHFLDALDTDKKHLLVVGAGYEHSVAREGNLRSVEHKIMLDATLRYAFRGDLLMSNRNRSEFRWINGDRHFRYRSRAMFERPVRLLFRDLTPYAAAEAVWDKRYQKWSIFKFSAGLVVPVAHVFSLELLYERQHCVTCSDPHTNIFGLTVNVALKMKKK